jgi:hypothetical protein
MMGSGRIGAVLYAGLYAEGGGAKNRGKQGVRTNAGPDSKSGGVTPVWVQVPPSASVGLTAGAYNDGDLHDLRAAVEARPAP